MESATVRDRTNTEERDVNGRKDREEFENQRYAEHCARFRAALSAGANISAETPADSNGGHDGGQMRYGLALAMERPDDNHLFKSERDAEFCAVSGTRMVILDFGPSRPQGGNR